MQFANEFTTIYLSSPE